MYYKTIDNSIYRYHIGHFSTICRRPHDVDVLPFIMVTCSTSEAESDVEAVTASASTATGMCYLSPFSMCSRADRIASESNLSSSGYSSMASPGPSRCGSSNPLSASEVEVGVMCHALMVFTPDLR